MTTPNPTPNESAAEKAVREALDAPLPPGFLLGDMPLSIIAIVNAAPALLDELAAARAEIDRLCGPICPLDGKRAIEHRHGAEWCLTWHHAYRDNGGRCAAKKHIPGARGYVCRKPEAAYLHQPCEHPHSWPEGMAWKRAYQTIGGAFAAEATTEEG